MFLSLLIGFSHFAQSSQDDYRLLSFFVKFVFLKEKSSWKIQKNSLEESKKLLVDLSV